jgi:CheY-like chemotaxis protein
MGFTSNKLTAVVVDDDRATVQIFIDVLRMMDLEVLASGYDGKDAVRLYKKYSPNIIFIDIMMPEYDGFYALEEIRKFNPQAKVVAVTGDSTDETAKRLKELNISAVIYKPYDRQDIKKVLYEKYQIKIR